MLDHFQMELCSGSRWSWLNWSFILLCLLKMSTAHKLLDMSQWVWGTDQDPGRHLSWPFTFCLFAGMLHLCSPEQRLQLGTASPGNSLEMQVLRPHPGAYRIKHAARGLPCKLSGDLNKGLRITVLHLTWQTICAQWQLPLLLEVLTPAGSP